MPPRFDPDSFLETLLTDSNVDVGAIEQEPRATISPRLDGEGMDIQRAYALLSKLGKGRAGGRHVTDDGGRGRSSGRRGGPRRAVTESSTGEGKELLETLRLHEKIGQGGMGEVWLGTQAALGRKVAVKCLRRDRRNDVRRMRLLREAWITGALEHPNIVPVHDIEVDEDGEALVVLKRIQGVEWATLMTDASEVKRRFGSRDLLEWNLQILMQVCNAVHFAHSRGIVHRDLKPANVMIGEFGEVYLLDWGVAISVDGDNGGRFPVADSSSELAGTPVYMAPEMLHGPEDVTPRTDVYLLGAILYEILAGDPPHVRDRLMDIIASVVESEPKIPAGVPEELAEIALRAMRSDPADRFASAEALRLSLVRFLEHRGSLQLSKRAATKAKQMRALLGFAERRPGETVSDREHERIYRLFGEARFGFRQALRAWPNNHSARAGLAEIIEAMVRYELKQGDPRTASVLVKELERPPPGLIEEVQEARRKAEERQAELERLNREQDPARGRRTRVILLSALTGTWILTMIGVGIAQLTGRHVIDSQLDGALYWGIFLLPTLVVGYIRRAKIQASAFNRRAAQVVLLTLTAMPFSHLTGWLAHTDVQTTTNHHFLLWLTIVVMMSIYVDRRLWVSAAIHCLGFILSSVWPEVTYLAAAGAHAGFLISMVRLNAPVMHLSVEDQEEQEEAAPRRRPPSASLSESDELFHSKDLPSPLDTGDLPQQAPITRPPEDTPALPPRSPLPSIIPPAHPTNEEIGAMASKEE